MEQEKRNQYMLIAVVVILLIVVFAIGLFLAIKYKNKHLNNKEYYFNQIYISEYKLDMADEDFYIGYLDDQQINVIINKTGKEVFSNGINIYYDGIYKTKEDDYIIYSTKDNSLVIYSFDGEKLEKIKEYSDVSYAKPIIYTNGNIEYIVGFTSQELDGLNIFMLNDLERVVIPDAYLVADDLYNGVYYTYSTENLIVYKPHLYGAINYEGKITINYKYKELKNTYNNSFIVKDKKNNYGIIDKNGKELVKAKYKAIGLFGDYYLVVNSKNEMAVYDKNYKNITGFEMSYDPLLEYEPRSSINSFHLWKVGSNLVVVNNYLQDFNKTEYSKSNAYFIKNNKIVKTIKQIGFANNGVVYSYDKDYKVTIYDSDLEVVSEFKVDNAKKILSISREIDDVIKVKCLTEDDSEKDIYYKNGEVIDYSYGELIATKGDIYVIKTDTGVSLYDRNLNKLDSLEGNNIEYKNDYLIVDNGIYKIEKRS
ncbi:MAG: WG repeat-containing protein [Bacilli bacterium]|nr:WG repeat-containing protein [Bacilli bacterium]